MVQDYKLYKTLLEAVLKNKENNYKQLTRYQL